MALQDDFNKYGFQLVHDTAGNNARPQGSYYLVDSGQYTGGRPKQYFINDPTGFTGAGLTFNDVNGYQSPASQVEMGSGSGYGFSDLSGWLSQAQGGYANSQLTAQQNTFATTNATNPNSSAAMTAAGLNNATAPLGNVSNAAPGASQVGPVVSGQAQGTQGTQQNTTQTGQVQTQTTDIQPTQPQIQLQTQPGLQMPNLTNQTSAQAQGNPQYDAQGQLVAGTGQTPTQPAQSPPSGLNFDQGAAQNQASPPQYDQQGQLVPGTGGAVEQINQQQNQAHQVLTDNGIDPNKVLQEGGYKNPYQTFIDTYTNVLKQMGIADVKSQLANINKQYLDLQNKKNDEIQAINDNPWLVEGIRLKKIDSINNKYEVREKNLTGQISNMQKLYDDGVTQAKFVAEQAVNIAHNQAVLDQNLLIAKANLAEKQLEFDLTLGTKNIPASYQEYQLAKAEGFKGTYNDYQTMDANRKRPVTNNYSILNQLRQLDYENKTAVAAGQIVNKASGLPVNITDAAALKISDFQNLIGQTQYVKQLISKLGTTGALKGWTTKEGVYVPVVQGQLNPDQVEAYQELQRLTNAYVYAVSGKQINEQEFVRIAKTAPSIQATSENNQRVTSNFERYVTTALDNYLNVNGWKIATQGNTQGTTQGNTTTNDPLGLR